MLASKDFGFMLTQGLFTMLAQLFLLKTWCSSISDIFSTFVLRLGSYAIISLIRVGLGYGKLGRTLSNGGRGIFFKRKPINGAVNGVQWCLIAILIFNIRNCYNLSLFLPIGCISRMRRNERQIKDIDWFWSYEWWIDVFDGENHFLSIL